jgi:hypothetical protein
MFRFVLYLWHIRSWQTECRGGDFFGRFGEIESENGVSKMRPNRASKWIGTNFNGIVSFDEKNFYIYCQFVCCSIFGWLPTRHSFAMALIFSGLVLRFQTNMH